MKRGTAWIMAGLMAACLHAQDADLFFAGRAQLLLDPSRAGFGPGGRITLVHRDQWLQMPGAWRNDLLAAEWNLRNHRRPTDSWLGMGVVAGQDRQPDGALRLTSVGVAPAMHLRAGQRSFLSAGLEMRWTGASWGEADGAWGTQYDGMRYDPTRPSGEHFNSGRAAWLVARAGLSFTVKNDEESRFRRERNILVAGVAADHLGHLVLHEEGTPPPAAPMRFTAYVLAELPHEIWDNGFFAGELTGQLQGPFRTGRMNLYAGKHLLNMTRHADGPALVGFKAGLGWQVGNALLANAALDWGSTTFGLAYGWAMFNTDAAVAGRRTVEVMLQVRFAGGAE